MKTIVIGQPARLSFVAELCARDPFFIVAEGLEDRASIVAHIQNNPVEFALVDLDLASTFPGEDPIALGKFLRQQQPQAVLIYLTKSGQRLWDCLTVQADYVTFPPETPEEAAALLQRARLLSARQKKRVNIRTFGRFEVFVEDRVVRFSSAKAKELLAVLVDRRGGVVNSDELISLIWEDRPSNDASHTLCRQAAAYLRKTLREYDAEAILCEHKRGRSLNADLVDCDYYQFLSGDSAAAAAFCGQYMSQYSWAETTLAALERLFNK